MLSQSKSAVGHKRSGTSHQPTRVSKIEIALLHTSAILLLSSIHIYTFLSIPIDPKQNQQKPKN
jgi:hypothetical protein